MSWTASAGATYYELEQRAGGTGNFKRVVPGPVGTATTFTVTGLNPGTRYDYRVRGVQNSFPQVKSPDSNEVMVTTQAGPPLTNQALRLTNAGSNNVYFASAADSEWTSATAELTVEAWIYPTENHSYDRAIVSKYNDINKQENPKGGYELRLTKANAQGKSFLEFEIFDNAGDSVAKVKSTREVPLNQWTFVAGSMGEPPNTPGNVWRLAVVVGSTYKESNAAYSPDQAPDNGSTPLLLGARYNSRNGQSLIFYENGFVGLIDEVRLSDTARYSALTLPDDNTRNQDGNLAHTLALWKMNAANGQIQTYDWSGHGCTLTTYGATWDVGVPPPDDDKKPAEAATGAASDGEGAAGTPWTAGQIDAFRQSAIPYELDPEMAGAMEKGATATSAGGGESIGLYRPATGQFVLRNENSSGAADATFYFGPGGQGWLPITGDWDGDGGDSAGVYDPGTGTFYLKNALSGGAADLTFAFGPSGGVGWKPIAGDWDNDGVDTIGLYNPAAGAFYLRNTNAVGAADVTFYFGPSGQSWQPLAADWDGDGDDTIGLYDGGTSIFYLRRATNTTGVADVSFQFGAGGNAGYQATMGDWDASGPAGVGLFHDDNSIIHLRNALTGGAADVSFAYGDDQVTETVVSGNWDGKRGPSGAPGAVAWEESYGYDRWGNMAIVGSGMAFDAATNRIAGGTYVYDAAGNVTQEGTLTRTFDWECRMTAASGATYKYDGDGRRISKTAGGVTTKFVYDGGGMLVAEYTSTSGTTPVKEYYYGAEGLLATGEGTSAGTLRWVTADHLGTPRVVTDAGGQAVMRRDYAPFGEDVSAKGSRTLDVAEYGASDALRQRFTGYERDDETGLDFAQARHYQNTFGRFISPDLPFVDQWEEDPQTWNSYSYVRNNPLSYSDPTGLAKWEKNGNGEDVWVGEYPGEFNPETGEVWNAEKQYWEWPGERPKYDKSASYFATAVLILETPVDLFKSSLGVESKGSNVLEQAAADNPESELVVAELASAIPPPFGRSEC